MQQLRGMAAAAHGHYWPAAKGDDLLRSLRAVVFKTPENYVVLDKAGKQIAANVFGSTASMPEGQYTLRTNFGGHDFDAPFWIAGGEATSVVFDANKIPADVKGPTAATPATPAGPETSTAPPAAPAAQHKFCTSCGAPLPAGAKFCPKCGAKVD
jgi:hypothetical protein